MDSQFSYKDTQIDLTVGQAILELGEAWITENEQVQRFLTPQADLLTRIEQVLNKYKEDSPDQEPDFEFKFDAMTVSDIASECIMRNVRFLNMTQTVSNKVFYDRSWNENPNSKFVKVSRPEAADPMAEYNALHYIDGQKYVPD
jgi:hypothetical protein